MEEVEGLIFNFPLFKDYREKKRFLKVIGLLVSHQVTFEKAAELLNMKLDEPAFLLDKLGVKYSSLDEEEIRFEREGAQMLLNDLTGDDS